MRHRREGGGDSSIHLLIITFFIMKSFRLTALAAAVGVGAICAAAADAPLVETRAYYSTNPADAVGAAASITVDGKFADWSDALIVATGGANDQCNAFKGGHENCVLDMYAVYAAWDDANLYIAWQMCNTGDTWARPGDGPLTDYGRIGNVPLIVALSVDPSAPAMSGKLADGRFIWGDNAANGVQFASHVDHLFFMSGKVGDGTPAMFTACDASGAASYAAAYCKPFSTIGVSYAMAEGFVPSHLWRQNTTADWATPTELISAPEIVDNIYYPACYDNLLAGPVAGLQPHDTKYDSFYEMKIPLSVLGIDRAWLEANGIGVRVVATRGESGIDCCPWDPAMMDNALGEYGKDPSTSHEKDDIDIITYALASVGKMRTGSVSPLPNPDPTPDPNPNPGDDPNTGDDPVTPPANGNYTVYFDNSASGWTSVYTWIWDAADGNRNYSGGSWPGTPLTVDSTTGYHRYSFACNSEAPKLMCIFNPGSNQGKTADLELVNNGIYTAQGFSGKTFAGVADVTADIAGGEFFTLQGVRVASPSSPGIYICRKGAETRKFVVK